MRQLGDGTSSVREVHNVARKASNGASNCLGFSGRWRRGERERRGGKSEPRRSTEKRSKTGEEGEWGWKMKHG